MLDIASLSVVFISYDEPAAERNWEALRGIVPGALRVHGVKGFDAAHRRAGEVARTPHVITIDGDNVVCEPDFFSRRLSFRPDELTAVISYSARVRHNGLTYGFGGLKIWPRLMLRSLRTHEASKRASLNVDFAWQIPQVQAGGVPTETDVTATPFQAFRSGLREGMRCTMQHGRTIREAFPDLPPAESLRRFIARPSVERLRVWCSVGRDFENGAWAMLGARAGCVMVALDDADVSMIADFDRIEAFWRDEVEPKTGSADRLDAEIARLGKRIERGLELEVADLSPDASRFAKSIYRAPRRLGMLLPD